MSAKAIISVTATVSTIAQFLTGVPICMKVRRQGEAGDVSGLPFAAGTFSCSVWLKYGMVIKDAPMMVVNLSGLLMQAAYLAFYYRFCRGSVSLTAVRRQVAALLTLVAAVYWYVDMHEQDRALAQYRLGFMAASASIAFSASPLASVAEVIRSKSTEVLPLPLLLVTFFVMLQWAIYGTLIEDAFVQVPNMICTCICGVQLMLFLIYPRTARKQNISLTAVRRQIAALLMLVAAVYWYVDMHEQDRALAQYRLGFMAASASIAFSASPLASVAEVIRSKSTEVLPLPLLLVTFFVMLQWAIYGTLIEDAFVQVPNMICTCICGVQLMLFLIYPRTARKQNVS